MKVLAIVGTTRKKGDNYHVIRQIEESMNRIEPVEFKYLYLSEVELGYCLGCGACFSKGEEFCPKRKLTAEIEAELLQADGIIFASPVYAHQVTAVMKNFMDHFAYLFHRPRFFDKAAIVLSTTGGSGLTETLNYLKFTLVGWGFYVIANLGIISPAFKNNEIYRIQKTKEIHRITVRMLQYMKTKKRPAPSIYELLFFRGMRFKVKNNPHDRKYWEERGWLKQGYYVNGPLNPVNLGIATILEGLMGLAYKRMGKS